MNNAQNTPTDPTESWLQDTLADYRPVAPTDAWDRLIPHLPQRKRRRVLTFWLSGAAASALVVWTTLFFFTNQINTPQVVTVTDAGQETKTRSVQQMIAESAPQSIIESGQQSVSLSAPQNADRPMHEQQTTQPNDRTRALKFPQKNDQIEVQSALKPLGFVQNSATVALTKTVSLGDGVFHNTLSNEQKALLKPLPTRTIEPVYDVYTKQLRLTNMLVTPIIAKPQSRRFWLGIDAGQAVFLYKSNTSGPVGLAFDETFTGHGNGWQLGVSFAYALRKRWRIASGLQYVTHAINAQHTAILRLMDGVCLNPQDPGLKEYAFNYSVVSGGEPSKLTLRLQQQDLGSAMPLDEPLNMQTRNHLQVWRVPLSVERNMDFGAHNGRWRGLVSGGAIINFAQKSSIQVTHYTEACKDLCFQSGHTPNIQSDQSRQITNGWLAAIGVERLMSKRSALRLEPYLVAQKNITQYGFNFQLLFSY
jgi:hypothetical protein